MSVQWLNPAALAGLAAVAGPLIVHLLRRQRAVRLRFATVRFIAAASTEAVRPRPPSDRLLLLVRAAIVAGAAAALAEPIVMTPARRAAWDARISRAIVVDASPSMSEAATRAGEAAAAERIRAAHAITLQTREIGEGIARAVAQLRAAPASRREIVIVSDLHGGSVTPADLETIPRSFGVRFVDVGRLPAARTVDGGLTFGAGPIEPRAASIDISADGTAVRLTPQRSPLEGLRIVAGRHADALLRTVALAGAPAPSPAEPLAVTFAPVPVLASLAPWMTRTVLGMRRDQRLAAAAREHRASPPGAHAGSPPWAIVAHSGSGDPIVLAGASGRELVILVRASPGEFVAAAALRSALLARHSHGPPWQEQEVERIPESTLSAWTRAPQPFVPGAGNVVTPHGRDGRVVWLLVLGLLLLETMMRRPRRPGTPEQYADAA